MGTPALIMFLSRWWKWIDRVSPMAILYVIGLLVANLTPWLSNPQLLSLNNTVGNVCIPLAIPMMLISCSLTNWSTGKALKCFFSALVAILIVTVVGFFIFSQNDSSKHFAQICAVAIGIYTGGIPNMGAIAQGVGMDQETYLYITSYDLIVTGLYLIFVICFGKPVFRKLLPFNQSTKDILTQETHNDIPLTPKWMEAIPIMLSVLIAVASYLISTLFPANLSTPILILILTSLAIAASFLPIVKNINHSADAHGKQPISFNAGLYFVYLFCFSIANACDVRTMNLSESLNILWFIFFVVFGSLVLQILFSRLLKIDGDSTLVTSVTLINSPPFVPLVAALLNNKNLIVFGISIGLLGYMLGNYLGIALYFILSTL